MKLFTVALFGMALLFSAAYASSLPHAEENSQQEQLVQYLSELMAIKSVTADQEANRQALKWVEKQLQDMNLHVHPYEFNGSPSLVITTQNTKAPKVLLAAHIDVVPAPDELFTAKIADGVLYGRGSYDMKMAIACYILLFKELKAKLPEYDFGMMLTSDEEVGGMQGTKRLLDEGYRAGVVLLPDGGFDWRLEKAAKGVLLVRLEAKGLSAHGSRPWDGENAIEKIIATIQDMQGYFNRLKSQSKDYYATMNIGTISGGAAANQVPDMAEAKIDIRFPAPMTAAMIMQHLEALVKGHKGVTLEKLIDASPSQVDLSLPAAQNFRAIAKKMYDIDVGEVSSHGASDARFFGEHNIPVLVIAPKGGDIHSDKEWIDIADLVRFYRTMKAWVIQEAS